MTKYDAKTNKYIKSVSLSEVNKIRGIIREYLNLKSLGVSKEYEENATIMSSKKCD